METCFTSCSAFTRAEEGGYVADPRDSGNWTAGQVGDGDLVGSNMGVGAPALAAWMGPGVTTSLNLLIRCLAVGKPQADLTQTLAAVRALESTLPESILPQICRSDVVILQGKLGIKPDGFAGPETTKQLTARPDLYVTALILALSSAQINSYRRLANFPIYGAGWLARTARRQAVALTLAAASATHKPASALAVA